MAAAVGKELEKLVRRELEEDRLECYKFVYEFFKENKVESSHINDFKKKLGDVLKVILKDIASENNEVAQASLQVLGFILLLASPNADSLFLAKVQAEILDGVCAVIQKTTDKQTCMWSLWALSKQNFSPAVLAEKADSLINVLEISQCSKQFQSMTVEHESINLLIRLLEQIAEQLKPHGGKWGKLLYPHLVHNAPKVRERAFVAMEMALPLLLEHRDVIGKQLAADLKTLLISDLKKLLGSSHEIYALQVWIIYVKLLGKLLHHGSLINHMLPIPEQGFKHSSADVKCWAYKSWQVLIDNFAVNPDIITDQKRVKLIMQVFKINNAKSEAIAIDKMNAWWHFVTRLGAKTSLYFEQVVVPLLQFVVGGGHIHNTLTKPGTPVVLTPGRGGMTSPATPMISVGSSTPGTSQPCYVSVMQLGCQVLARLLGCSGDSDADLPKYDFTLEELKPDIITGVSFYQKHAPVFINAFKCLVLSLGTQANDTLLYHTWYSLVAHTKISLEHGSRKDSVEVFTSLITCFQELVSSQTLHSNILMKMLEALLCLSPKVLGSPAYNITGSRDQVMQGCPALVLVELQFHHRILETQTTSNDEKFYVLLEKLVALVLGMQASVLQSCHTMLQLVKKSASFVEHKEALWRMWSIIVNPLHEHINKDNEVNQGDALEYNFSCLTLALTLPVTHILSTDITQGTLKSLSKTWCKLYVTFNRLAAMVSNAEANIACEEVCHKIISAQLDFTTLPIHVEVLSHSLLTMIEVIDFSSLANNFGFLGAVSHSPLQFGKKKHNKSLGNIESLVTLLAKVIEGLHAISCASLIEIKKILSFSALQTTAANLLQVVTLLFNHLPTTSMISATLNKLAAPVGLMLQDSAMQDSATSSKVYSNMVQQKMDKMWTDLVACIQARHNGPYDTHFLQDMAPLLQHSFLHSRRAIKNQTIILWNATFASASSLDYPEELKSVLQQAKKKTMILTPGLETCQIVIEETPASQIEASEAPVLPNIVGLASPVKNVGSFLNKAVSPNVKHSPLKRNEGSPFSKKAVRSLSEMKDNEFVVINNLPKKKRVLTEHQKEVLKERSTIPAMYNNLDVSQDVSLMSQFLSTDSQMSQISTPTPTSDMKIAPFPFVLPDKPVSKNPTDKIPKSISEDLDKEPKILNKLSPESSKQEKNKKIVRFHDQKDEAEPDKPDTDKDTAMFWTETESKQKESQCEVVIIESESQEDPDKTIYIGSQTQDESKTEKDKTAAVLQGSETQSSQVSQNPDPNLDIKMPDVETAAKDDDANDTTQVQKQDTEESSKTTGKRGKTRLRRSEVAKAESSQANESQPAEPKENKTSKVSKETESQENQDTPRKEKPRTRSSMSVGGEDDASQSQDKAAASETILSTPKSKANSKNKTEENVSPSRRGRPPKNKKIAPVHLVKSPDNKIDKWVVVSPRKPEPLTLVEESQFSMEEVLNKKNLPTDNITVKETPVKDSPSKDIIDIEGSSIVITRNLFEQFDKSSEPQKRPFQDLHTEGSNLDRRKPVVQLERLSQVEIEKHKRSSLSGSESDSAEKTGKENKSKTTLRRRNSLVKFSKAGKQEQSSENGISVSPVNMDDVIPSSQDAFSFQAEAKEPAVSEEGSITTMFVNELKPEAEKSPCVETEKEPPASSDSSSSSNKTAILNPDILPVSSSEMDESEPLSSTIICCKKQSSTLLDQNEDSQDSDISQGGRPKRIRKANKKYFNDELLDSPSAKSWSPLTKNISASTSGSQQSALQENKPKRKRLNLAEERKKLVEPTFVNEPLDSVEDSKEEGLDNFINQQCNLDRESDEEDAAAAGMSEFDSSTDDLPLADLQDDIPLDSLAIRLKAVEKKTAKKLLRNKGKKMQKKRGRKRKRSKEESEGTHGREEENEMQAQPEMQSEPEMQAEPELQEAQNQDIIEVISKQEVVEPEEVKKENEECVTSTTEKAPCENNDLQVNENAVQAKKSPIKSPTKSPKKGIVGNGTSPPKKGKPFDIPETPTSGKKYSSRASYILEQARKISMTKSFTSPSLIHRRKFTGIKSSPRLGRPLPGSILKMANKEGANETSPQNKNKLSGSPSFRPVNVHHVYSPSASPSAGILKKRRLTGDMHTDSPSPPYKQRRVCFNEQLDVFVTSPSASPTRPVNRCLELKGQQIAVSPLAYSDNSKAKLSKKAKDDEAAKNDNFVIPKSLDRPKDSQPMSMSEASVSTTQESQLNDSQPICARLADCEVPVEEVLPQLTSSTWVRGLSKVIRSRNIKTVGDLSSLSECDVQNLPIRSPKVETVRRVLHAFGDRRKMSNKEPSTEELTDVSSPNKLPNADEELDRMSPVKGDLDTSMESEEESPLVLDATVDNSEDPLAGVVPSTSCVKSENDMDEQQEEEEEEEEEEKVTALSLVRNFTSALTPALLSATPRHEMLQLHELLNQTISCVFLAMMNKCPLSPVWTKDDTGQDSDTEH